MTVKPGGILVRMSLAIGGLLTLLLVASPSPASAHTLTFYNATTATCANAGQTKSLWLFDNQGPVDKTWAVEVGADIQTGPGAVFDMYFSFYMYDNAISYGNVVATFEGGAHEWIQTYTKNYSSTVYAHVGGTFDLILTLTNAGSTYNCFDILAIAGWK